MVKFIDPNHGKWTANPAKPMQISECVKLEVLNAPRPFDNDIEALRARVDKLTDLVGFLASKLSTEDQIELAKSEVGYVVDDGLT